MRLCGWQTILSVSSDTSREGSPTHADRVLRPGKLSKALDYSWLELDKAARSWKLPDPCMLSLRQETRHETRCQRTLTRSRLVSPLKRFVASATGNGPRCQPASTRARWRTSRSGFVGYAPTTL